MMVGCHRNPREKGNKDNKEVYFYFGLERHSPKARQIKIITCFIFRVHITDVTGIVVCLGGCQIIQGKLGSPPAGSNLTITF